MILFDFECKKCGKVFEDLVKADEVVAPCECGYIANRCMPKTKTFTEIVPTSLHSKKRKAGYSHSHGDRPKTPGKIMVSVP